MATKQADRAGLIAEITLTLEWNMGEESKTAFTKRARQALDEQIAATDKTVDADDLSGSVETDDGMATISEESA